MNGIRFAIVVACFGLASVAIDHRPALSQVTDQDINPNPILAAWKDGPGPYSTPEGFTTGRIKFESGGHDVARVTMPENAPSIVSDYGSDYTALGKSRPQALRPHSGIDITAPMDYPVVAASDGKVVLARTFNSAGNSIVIEHGMKDGKRLLTAYIHLHEFLVPEGAKVKRGQMIATIGKTGRGWGNHAHLHWGVDLLPTSENTKAFYKYHVNPHGFWVDGPGRVTCFETGKAYEDPLKFTYPVPCLETADATPAMK